MEDASRGPRAPFRLAELTIRPDANEIVGEEGAVRVGPKAMDVLLALANRADAVITKQELLDSVWTDVYVGDEVLSTAVWELRRALGDDARSPRFIQTVPRRGYRLLIVPAAIAAAGDAVGQAAPLRPTAAPEPRRRWRPWAVAAWSMVVAAAIVLVAIRMLPAPRPGPVRALAVLPVESLEHDPRDEALAEGVTDTLITALAGIDGLRVVSRTTSRSYRGSELTVPEIADELGVDVVVEATLNREGDRVVLNAQLIDARSESHLWAETYERRFENLLDLQVEIARSIGAAIADRMEPPPEPAPAPQVPDAVTGSLLRWRFQTSGEVWSPPALSGDAVVFGSRDGNLYSVGLADGVERWRAALGGEVFGRPLVRDGAVYVTTHEGLVAALDADTGESRWRHRLGATSVCGPIGGAGLVVAADEAEQAVGLDPSSGRVLWTWQGGGGLVGVAAGGGRVVVSRFDGAVTMLDAVDGTEVWTVSVAEWLSWPATVDGDTVLVPSPTGAVLALGAADGREVWRAPVSFPSEVVVWRDRVLVGGAGEAVTALDRSSGELLWRFATLGFVHPPSVDGGLVLAGSQDDSLYVLDPWSGALRWRVDLRTWVTTTPLGVGDRVVFGSLDGGVYAVAVPPPSKAVLAVRQEEGFRARPASSSDRLRGWDLVVETGDRPRPRVRWRVAADGPVTIAPRIVGDAVLVAGDRTLSALATADGSERWATALGGAAGTVPAVVGELVVEGARDGVVAAFGLADGREQWRVATGGDVISTPAVSGDMLVFGSRDGHVYAVDARDGSERWRRRLDVIHGSPAVADGVVYVPSRGDILWALAADDGSVVWSAPTADWAVADPVVWRDLVLLGSCDGTFEAFDRSTGDELWRLATGGDIWYRPAVDQDTVYFGSGDHHLYAADAASGRERWRRRTGNRVWSSVVRWRDLAIAGSFDRQLWAVDAATGRPVWRLATTGAMGSPAVSGDLLAVGSEDGFVYLVELDPKDD